MQFLRSLMGAEETAANGVVIERDLPVNPVTGVLITVKFLNDTGTASQYTIIAAALAVLSNINVAYRGANIIDGSGADLAQLMACMTGEAPSETAATTGNDAARSVTLPLYFGRTPYDPKECFPATRRGDLILRITPSLPQTGIDTVEIVCESIELLDAKPERFAKVTTISRVFNSTGDQDIDLPISNRIAGALLFDPLAAGNTDDLYWWGKSVLAVDNVQQYYNATTWQSLRGEYLRRYPSNQYVPHQHAGLANTSTGVLVTYEQAIGAAQGCAYAYMDLDPLKDDSYLLDTRGAARVFLRTTVQAATANAARCLPIEIVDLSQGGSSK